MQRNTKTNSTPPCKGPQRPTVQDLFHQAQHCPTRRLGQDCHQPPDWCPLHRRTKTGDRLGVRVAIRRATGPVWQGDAAGLRAGVWRLPPKPAAGPDDPTVCSWLSPCPGADLASLSWSAPQDRFRRWTWRSMPRLSLIPN
jgi:hypothetical protein